MCVCVHIGLMCVHYNIMCNLGLTNGLVYYVYRVTVDLQLPTRLDTTTARNIIVYDIMSIQYNIIKVGKLILKKKKTLVSYVTFE